MIFLLPSLINWDADKTIGFCRWSVDVNRWRTMCCWITPMCCVNESFSCWSPFETVLASRYFSYEVTRVEVVVVARWSKSWHSSSSKLKSLWNTPSVIWRPGGHTYFIPVHNNATLKSRFILFLTCVNGISKNQVPITLSKSFAFFRLPPACKKAVCLSVRVFKVLRGTPCLSALGIINLSDVIAHHRQQWRPENWKFEVENFPNKLTCH